jgi:hypothetical protein
MADLADDEEPSVSISDLHHRHPGLTEAVCEAYAEATAVCLHRHHAPPSVFAVWTSNEITQLRVQWRIPPERVRRAWLNDIDTTEAGAYAVALAAVEAAMGLVTISRARSMSGADYYVAIPSGGDLLEECQKLEVSGIDHGGVTEMRRRLREKIAQVTAYGAPAGAIACVVGFKLLSVLIREA